MPRIAPNLAAGLAHTVYGLVDFNVEEGIAVLHRNYGQVIQTNSSSVASCRTGGPGFIKSQTAFGFVCLGNGAYKGHAFLVVRGTKFLADWLTNFNIGTSRSMYGQPVHDGFNRAFRSMRQQIEAFVSGLSTEGVHSVHCIGHSLGGALATLIAEYVSSATTYKPYLYTFGAPRVGLQSFSDMLTTNLSPERMFRVYHRTDIVPCIPFWPFVHAPTRLSDTYDYFQPSPGSFPGAEWHDMGLYAATVGRNNWQALRGKRSQQFSDQAVEAWINKKSPVAFNITNLEWLDNAINYLLKVILGGIGAVLTSAIGSSLTLMDQLAIIIRKGIDLSKNVSGLVLSFLRKVMEILGMRPALDAADATYSFIRNLFERLSQRVSAYCQRILDQVLVNGQGV